MFSQGLDPPPPSFEDTMNSLSSFANTLQNENIDPFESLEHPTKWVTTPFFPQPRMARRREPRP